MSQPLSVIAKRKYIDHFLNVYGTPDIPLFKAQDIGDLLGMSNIRKRLAQKNDNGENIFPKDFLRVTLSYTETGKKRMMNFLTEEGVYFLAMRSDKPEAVAFSKWVAKMVKQLFKTGYIEVPQMKPLETPEMVTERQLTTEVVKYLQSKEAEYKLMCTPSLGELFGLSAETRGYKRGTFDFICINKTKQYNGFALELKSPNGNNQLSEDQKVMLEKYKDLNYLTLVSNDYQEIVKFVDNYCDGILIKCNMCSEYSGVKDSLTLHYQLCHYGLRNKVKLIMKSLIDLAFM